MKNHTFKIVLTRVPPSQNVYDRMHYRLKTALRTAWEHDLRYSLTKDQFKALKAHAELGHSVKVSVHVMHKKLFDHGNLVGGFKPCMDALVNIGVLADDKPEFIGEPVFSQEKNRMELTTITLEPQGAP